MNRITSGLILIIVLAISAFSQPSPTLTIINQTEESATVRIVGPTTRNLEVASGARGITSVSGGTYRLRIRYCNGNGNCHYSESDSFTVSQSVYEVSHVTVTLHSVGGNLNERSISEAEFNGSD